MGNPKTDRKMNDFRIFCELIAKTMLQAIDFTDVLEVYRRKEKPEILGIATYCSSLLLRTLQSRKEKPEILGIATSSSMRRQLMPVLSRNEKPDIVGHRDINKKSLIFFCEY